MATLELKKYLVSKINLIEDDSVLDKIKAIVDKQESVYVLSQAQLKSIEESEQQILRGEYFDQDEMDKKFEEWLKAE
jgi:hypothetical protein